MALEGHSIKGAFLLNTGSVERVYDEVLRLCETAVCDIRCWVDCCVGSGIGLLVDAHYFCITLSAQEMVWLTDKLFFEVLVCTELLSTCCTLQQAFNLTNRVLI